MTSAQVPRNLKQQSKMGVEESVYLAKLAEQAERYEGTSAINDFGAQQH